ncbi:MAG: type II toxin-antitoxin system HicB family antitoxin [Candidatus Aenigmarchaeota archaeon]|nr:type II toxin-antitoxin system HicB family antitoxin [Candidatus Aenigmarchaeota archaeon]
MTKKLFVLIEKSKKYYIGTVAGLPGCRNRAKTHKELLRNIRKTIKRCLKVEGGTPYGEFVGVRILNPQNFRKTFIVLIEKGETGAYVGYVPSLSGCFTQAGTLEKLVKNLEELIEICFGLKKTFEETKFVGMQMVEVK